MFAIRRLIARPRNNNSNILLRHQYTSPATATNAQQTVTAEAVTESGILYQLLSLYNKIFEISIIMSGGNSNDRIEYIQEWQGSGGHGRLCVSQLVVESA
jgi:hypothetical protein